MNYNSEYAQNRFMLKKCQKIYNFTAIAYGIICLPMAFCCLYLMILTVSNDVLLLFLAAVFKLATFFAGYNGCYQHENKFAYYAVGIGGFDFCISGLVNDSQQSVMLFINSLNFLFIFVYVVLCALTVYNNKNYAYLEQQEGFPQFSERFEEQKAMKDRDVYAERYEEIKKASSGKSNMDEL